MRFQLNSFSILSALIVPSLCAATEINQINLLPCGGAALDSEEIVTLPAVEILPSDQESYLFHSVEGTTFGPNPYVVMGFMPVGLADSINEEYAIQSQTSFLISALINVEGNDPFTDPFVAVLAVVPHPELNQGPESIQCAIVYYTAGDPANVAEYINAKGDYVGPHPATGGAGTWIGSGADAGDAELTAAATEADASIHVTVDSKNGASVQAQGGCGVIQENQRSFESYFGLIAMILVLLNFLRVSRRAHAL